MTERKEEITIMLVCKFYTNQLIANKNMLMLYELVQNVDF